MISRKSRFRNDVRPRRVASCPLFGLQVSACDCRFASEAAHKAGRFDLFYSTSLHLATLRARFVLLHYFFHSSSIERGLPRVSVLNQVWWREPVSRSLTHAGPTTAVV